MMATNEQYFRNENNRKHTLSNNKLAKQAYIERKISGQLLCSVVVGWCCSQPASHLARHLNHSHSIDRLVRMTYNFVSPLLASTTRAIFVLVFRPYRYRCYRHLGIFDAQWGFGFSFGYWGERMGVLGIRTSTTKAFQCSPNAKSVQVGRSYKQAILLMKLLTSNCFFEFAIRNIYIHANVLFQCYLISLSMLPERYEILQHYLPETLETSIPLNNNTDLLLATHCSQTREQPCLPNSTMINILQCCRKDMKYCNIAYQKHWRPQFPPLLLATHCSQALVQGL